MDNARSRLAWLARYDARIVKTTHSAKNYKTAAVSDDDDDRGDGWEASHVVAKKVRRALSEHDRARRVERRSGRNLQQVQNTSSTCMCLRDANQSKETGRGLHAVSRVSFNFVTWRDQYTVLVPQNQCSEMVRETSRSREQCRLQSTVTCNRKKRIKFFFSLTQNRLEAPDRLVS